MDSLDEARSRDEAGNDQGRDIPNLPCSGTREQETPELPSSDHESDVPGHSLNRRSQAPPQGPNPVRQLLHVHILIVPTAPRVRLSLTSHPNRMMVPPSIPPLLNTVMPEADWFISLPTLCPLPLTFNNFQNNSVVIEDDSDDDALVRRSCVAQFFIR